MSLSVGKKLCSQQDISTKFEIHRWCDLYLGVVTASIIHAVWHIL